MIPVWIGVVLHFVGLILGVCCHALATRNKRPSTIIVDTPQARRWIANGPRFRVVTTTIREDKR
jgi:hypothetical protein